VPFPEQVRNHKFKEASEKFTKTQGLTDDAVQAVLEDREGNIWVGTDGGLDRFRNRNVLWYPLPGGRFSLVAGDHGDVWAGSSGDEPHPVLRVQGRKPARNGPTNVFMAYRDPGGSIWISAKDSLWR